MLNGLDLFSGIGGLTEALGPWVSPIAYCENDPYCQSVLLCLMRQRRIPIAPVWDDIKSLTAKEVRWVGSGRIDIIYGGFPCQDISVAGARRGLSGKQSSLFFEAVRLINEIRPWFVFLENTGHTFETHVAEVSDAFYKIGFVLRDCYLSAANVGANHKRERWFGLAYPYGIDLWKQPWGSDGTYWESTPKHFKPSWWASEPRISRVANGVPARVDRARALGNAVVPLQAREAFKKLMGLV